MPLPVEENQINRLPIRENVFKRLLNWIIDGVLRPGEKMDDSDSPGTFAQTAITGPLTALKEACAHLGIKRLGSLTPYVPSVTAAIRAALEAAGLEIVAFGSFEQSDERLVARISPQSVRELFLRAAQL